MPREMNDARLIIKKRLADIRRTHCHSLPKVDIIPALSSSNSSLNLPHFLIESKRACVDWIRRQKKNPNYRLIGFRYYYHRREQTRYDRDTLCSRNPIPARAISVSDVKVDRHLRARLLAANKKRNVRRVSGTQFIHLDARATLIGHNSSRQRYFQVGDVNWPNVGYSAPKVAPFVVGKFGSLQSDRNLWLG